LFRSKNPSRRKFLKTGLTSLAATTASAKSILDAPKKPGEVRVLFLVGDYWHNAETQEIHWRKVLGPTGWRLLFAQSSRFVTPEVLSKTDLFVFCRYGGPAWQGWSGEEIVEVRPTGAPWMTDELEEAIVENVNRGMGLLPYHCSIYNGDKKKYMALLGVKKPIVHGNIREMTTFYDMNQNHPITRGIEPFEEFDEIFDAEFFDVEYEVLFRAKQDYPKLDKPYTFMQHFPELIELSKVGAKLDRPGGWTREVGDGRVVFLNCGSTPEVFWRVSMKEMMWRSAHWAMKKDIPPSNVKEGL